jgi:ribosomal protein S18 acetylase RimI-like enzyme
MLTYSPATPKQVNEFLSLLRSDTGYITNTLNLMQMTWEQFAQMVRTTGHIFAICQDEQVAGYYWIEERERILHLHGIVVKGSYQSQGIGTAVLTMLRDQYRDSLDAIELGVHESNSRARKLYERLGFRLLMYLKDLGYYVLQLPLS